jgi:hypothetical protein
MSMQKAAAGNARSVSQFQLWREHCSQQAWRKDCRLWAKERFEAKVDRSFGRKRCQSHQGRFSQGINDRYGLTSLRGIGRAGHHLNMNREAVQADEVAGTESLWAQKVRRQTEEISPRELLLGG